MYTFLFFLIKSNSIKGIFCKILNNRCFILCFGSYLRGQKAVFAQNIKTFRQYVVFNNFRETKMIITGLKVSVYTAEFCCCNSGSVQVFSVIILGCKEFLSFYFLFYPPVRWDVLSVIFYSSSSESYLYKHSGVREKWSQDFYLPLSR